MGWAKGLAFEAPSPTLSPTEAAEASVASNAGLPGFLFLFAFRFLGSCLAHGLAAQLDTMSVVHEPVEDTVGDGGVSDLLVPLQDGNLRSQDRRSCLITLVTDFPEVAPLGFLHGRHGPVIDHQNIDTAEPGQHPGVWSSERNIKFL
jgi:hypothetical protein